MGTETYNYIKTNTIEEALDSMRKFENALFVAGGTDVFVNVKQGNNSGKCIIDVSGIEILNQISKSKNEMVIGSMRKLNELAKSEDISLHFPALKESILSIATPVIRKTATIGGNLLCENRCVFYNQSEWWRESVGNCLKCSGDICLATGGKKSCFSKLVSDTAPVLIAYGATINVVDSSNGNKEIQLPIEKLYSGNGIFPLSFDKKTLLKSIQIPISERSVVFRKLRPRKTLDFTSLTTAVSLDKDKNVCIAIGGVDPMPVVIRGNLTEVDRNELIKLACKKPRIVDNDYYSRTYRKDMIEVFVANSLEELGV